MKKVLYFVSVALFGYILGIASFFNGYQMPMYHLEWVWSIKDSSQDCLILWKRTSSHSSEGEDIVCFKNNFKSQQ